MLRSSNRARAARRLAASGTRRVAVAVAVMVAGLVTVPIAGMVPALATSPPAPVDCRPDTRTFTNTTPVAIPAGPAVVSSTIVVTGADTYLWDVDAQTFITHTFAADLDITLASPEGTVVTLTTDNGAGNDNVFNGTIWDDDANPAGQVPYVTNNGVASDHAYVNLALASPLVPEEAMGAFIGEDPNGTWTLTISDDLAGDSGSIDSWSLVIARLPVAPDSGSQTFTNTTPVAIPAGPAVVTATIPVSGSGGSIVDVNLQTSITHTFAADLDITLQSPAGTVVTLTTDNGAGNDNVFNGTIWDDDANPAGQVPYVTNNGVATDHAYVNLALASPLVPEEAMGAFIGEDPNGTWTLTISDDLAGDSGTLNSWSLVIATGSCHLAPPADPTLEVLRVGAGSGTITSSPGGINCPPDCSETPTPAVVAAGGVYLLTATAASGSVFTGWSGACSGTGICTVAVRPGSDVFVAAWFAPSSEPSPPPSPSPTPPPPAPVTFDLHASKVGKGRIVSDPAGIDCGLTCTATYDEGALIKVTATPQNGWVLARWKFGCSGSELTCSLEMSSNRRAHAVFVRA